MSSVFGHFVLPQLVTMLFPLSPELQGRNFSWASPVLWVAFLSVIACLHPLSSLFSTFLPSSLPDNIYKVAACKKNDTNQKMTNKLTSQWNLVLFFQKCPTYTKC